MFSTTPFKFKSLFEKRILHTDASESTNKRNGKTIKTIQSESGTFELEVPRDRQGEFEPKIVKKHRIHSAMRA